MVVHDEKWSLTLVKVKEVDSFWDVLLVTFQWIYAVESNKWYLAHFLDHDLAQSLIVYNTIEKASVLCNMLWSLCPYDVVMSFTRSKLVFTHLKLVPRAVRKIGHNLNRTTFTLPYHLQVVVRSTVVQKGTSYLRLPLIFIGSSGQSW